MIHLALIITHNKSDLENSEQIEILKPLIEKQTVLNDQYDENGNVVGQFETYYYTLKGLNLPHKLRVFQILPYQPNNSRLAQGKPYEGVWPTNANDIDSHRVAYGINDQDKMGDHPRFFNWGLKRGTDYGADIVIHLEDHKKFKVGDLPFYLNSLIDPEDKTEYAEDQSCKYATLKLLKEVGQLDEKKTKKNAVDELKQRVTEKGLKNG